MMRNLALYASLFGLSSSICHAAPPPQLRLPETFHGEWTTKPELCHSKREDASIWQVSAGRLRTQEGGACILTLTMTEGDAKTYDAVVQLSGGGGQWQALIRLGVDPERRVMEIEDLEGENELPGRLWRCAPPIPGRFTGRWASTSEGCGFDYSLMRITPSGIVLPDAAARTLSVKYTRQKKNEIMMDTTVSVAGISYDERRVLRLTRKGKSMEVLSLGKIERASDDPEWRLDPNARFRSADEPEQIEVLLRCPRLSHVRSEE